LNRRFKTPSKFIYDKSATLNTIYVKEIKDGFFPSSI
jgi:hypothetical protein